MMTPEDMKYVAAEAHRIAGLAIRPNQACLVEHRLAPLARAEGFETISAMLGSIRRDADPRLAKAAVESLACRESWFFRDRKPFDSFRQDILPVLARARGTERKIRIWCAGAGNGQEAYSLAMILEEEAERLGDIAVEIVATDFCARAIDRGRAGAFSQFDVQRGLSIQRLIHHFEQSGKDWRISAGIRRRVDFQQHNLLDASAALGMFDMILCRNVISAMTPDARKTVLTRLGRHLADDGYLILGEGETAAGAVDMFRSVRGKRGLYEKAAGDIAQAA
ncbi:CheR family methyltransferase [Hyphobacterium marinum]|uniref:Protein-glutamate O-methyltransferase CheR n=1 Tax=Hyphobacterium marinum TaxID=3116574 RepID=A0ABU7LXC0_9PROT|nr:protein-glutamate O-methyltransferase CheR [Hyphobacterium sp. Y6023]MEE2566213.1 protein-glutamate O-methyltransferase CheR [Hyphobacterium sp. Y6023]